MVKTYGEKNQDGGKFTMLVPNKIKLSNFILDKMAIAFQFDGHRPFWNEKLQNKMHKFMLESNGIGLAAPQCGIGYRFFVMDLDNGGDPHYCFNPEILSSSEETVTMDEGCLSFPDEILTITRAENIVVKYFDYEGNRIDTQFSGLHSVCFQHELDHLNGIVFHERVTK